MSEILKAYESPRERGRWFLHLSCGHKLWISQKSRPTRKAIPCPGCGGDAPALKKAA